MLSFCLRTSLGLLLTLLCCNLSSQETNLFARNFDSLAVLKEAELFDRYYDKLNYLANLYKEDGIYDHVDSLTRYYNYLPVTKQDSISFRRALFLHAYLVKNRIGDIQKGLGLYHKAEFHNVDLSGNLPKDCWFVEKPLANIYAALNDYERALHYTYKVKHQLVETKNYNWLARLLVDEGDLHFWLMDTVKAKAAYEDAYSLIPNLTSNNSKRAVYKSLSSWYLEIDNPGFIKKTSEAISYLHLVKDDSRTPLYLGNIFVLKGDYYVNKNQLDSARSNYLFAIKHLKSNSSLKVNRDVSKLYGKLAKLEINENLSASKKHLNLGYKSILPNYNGIISDKDISNENTFIQLLTIHSKLHIKKYDESGIEEHLDSAIYMIDLAFICSDLLFHQLNSEDSEFITQLEARSLAELAIGVCYQKYSINKNDIKLEKVSEYFNRAKNALLQKSREKQRLVKQLKPSVLNSYNKLQERQLELINSGISEEGNFVEFQANKVKINKLIPLKESNIKGLNKNTIDFIITKEYIYRLDNINTLKFRRIDEKEKITSLIKNTLPLFNSKSNIDSLKQNLKLLGKHLLKNINLNKNQTIRVKPDGLLALLPMDVLIVNNQYLIENHPISIQFFNNHESKEHVFSQNKLLIAKPNYSPDSNLYSDERDSPYQLKYTSTEVQKIKNLWKDTVNIIYNLNAEDLFYSSSEYDIFHYAGHANLIDGNSYLSLDADEKNKLTLSQLSQIPLNFNLAVLSACQTGVGFNRHGEGIRSLANTFLANGTNSIVYSLWKTNDKSSADLMSDFYKNLDQDQSKITSLRNAKLKFLKEASPNGRHPYYWAAFHLAGDESPLYKESTNYTLLVVSILVSIFLIFFYLKYIQT